MGSVPADAFAPPALGVGSNAGGGAVVAAGGGVVLAVGAGVVPAGGGVLLTGVVLVMSGGSVEGTVVTVGRLTWARASGVARRNAKKARVRARKGVQPSLARRGY